MQGNSPSYELPVFVSPQAGDKGMCLFKKNTAALPWKRLLIILNSLSTQHNETVQFPPSLPGPSAPINTSTTFFFHIFSLFPSLDHCSGRDFLIIHPLFQKVKCRAVCMHVQMCLMVFCACCVQTVVRKPHVFSQLL